MNEEEPFYIWIQKKTAELGLRQKDICRALKLTAGPVSKWFAGVARPNTSSVSKLAVLLNVKPEEILKRL